MALRMCADMGSRGRETSLYMIIVKHYDFIFNQKHTLIQDHSVEQILGFYTATGQLVYLCLCSVALLVLVWSSLQLARIQRSPQPSQSHCVAAIRTRKKSVRCVCRFVYVRAFAFTQT